MDVWVLSFQVFVRTCLYLFRILSTSGLILLEVIEEVDTSDLRAEVKQLIAENDTLTEDNDLLTDENEHLTKGISSLCMCIS